MEVDRYLSFLEFKLINVRNPLELKDITETTATGKLFINGKLVGESSRRNRILEKADVTLIQLPVLTSLIIKYSTLYTI